MVYIFQKLFEILPNADDLLSLEPEELAGPLLVSLQGSDYISLFEVISYELLENAEIKEYLASADDILRALMEAWQWLEREGFVAPRPASLSRETVAMPTGTTYFVTSRGKRLRSVRIWRLIAKRTFYLKVNFTLSLPKKCGRYFYAATTTAPFFKHSKRSKSLSALLGIMMAKISELI